MNSIKSSNIDPAIVAGFAREWASFDQHDLPADEQERAFDEYFSEFPWSELSADAEGFDLGRGSGRLCGSARRLLDLA